MGLYKYVREAWKQPKKNSEYKSRLVEWRKQPVTFRVDKPTRIDRARAVGYKAKPGIIVVRQRVSRAQRRNPSDIRGRRPKRFSTIKVLDKTHKLVAEERVARKYKNCEVLNSYPVGEDGMSKWFEVILVDRTNPHILADKKLNWISLEKGRVFRGKTSSGKKSRGLMNKGKGAEKLRPSRSAVFRKKQKK